MIYYYTTQDKNCRVSFEDAVMRGMAEDGGLFIPERIPQMPEAFFKRISTLSFSDIAYDISSVLLQDVLSQSDLKTIIAKAFTFDAPLKQLSQDFYALELFHGPTLSFKDFGARFMAQLLSCFAQQNDKKLNILVATAGDTGSAIAQAFLNVPGTKVWILYPKGKVSWSQEKQLTTFGQNITALEIDGSFDDCQRLVKQAFSDPILRQKMSITSANSINIARLIPQMFYYFYAFAPLHFPSGESIDACEKPMNPPGVIITVTPPASAVSPRPDEMCSHAA